MHDRREHLAAARRRACHHDERPLPVRRCRIHQRTPSRLDRRDGVRDGGIQRVGGRRQRTGIAAPARGQQRRWRVPAGRRHHAQPARDHHAVPRVGQPEPGRCRVRPVDGRCRAAAQPGRQHRPAARDRLRQYPSRRRRDRHPAACRTSADHHGRLRRHHGKRLAADRDARLRIMDQPRGYIGLPGRDHAVGG